MPVTALKSTILRSLRDFAQAVTRKMAQPESGQPEEQLRSPFETLLRETSIALGTPAECVGEPSLPNSLGRPDYAVHVGGLLTGYAELKAPNKGADARRFRGRDRAQFNRFSGIPNLLYSDGNEWALYRNGEPTGRVVRLAGDVTKAGSRAARGEDAEALESLLLDFLSWKPQVATDSTGAVDLGRFAEQLAPLCRMLRDDVLGELKDPQSQLVTLQRDWRQLLFPDATDKQFADAYAQTVTFALLLGRSEGAEPLTLHTAQGQLAARHNLLSRALQVLTDVLTEKRASAALTASLDLLLRVIGVVPTKVMSAAEDPWLYFYEDFLAAYNPALRKSAGVYYTPVEVVRAQVRLVDDLLTTRLGKPLGFAEPDVVTLDPAAGTGTYLLGVISQALGRVAAAEGTGSVPGYAASLAANLYGFEFMTGPYAVAELRVSRALNDCGAKIATGGGPRIYLTDALESPHAAPAQLPLFLRPISDQRARALDVKSRTQVLVCLGNPPYARHQAGSRDNASATGDWVRWGDPGSSESPLLADFIGPAKAGGHGIHQKNLYNLYVYFWRWALWRVFEHESAKGPGVVSFISAASYIDGAAFCGMREHMRRVCDEIWILDLGGEGHAPPHDENVFAIRTPVAIAVAVRAQRGGGKRPATVWYGRIAGTRVEKLQELENVTDFASVKWQPCPSGWQDAFRPSAARTGMVEARTGLSGPECYALWPCLTDLMPWQHSGTQAKRTWPIAPDTDTLERRWSALLHARDRAAAFREDRDRRIDREYSDALSERFDPKPIGRLPPGALMPKARRYAYRSFDRQYLIVDGRLVSYLRPPLWKSQSASQVFLTGLLTRPLGPGPALTATAWVPDLHHFSGRGGKDAIPLYRTADTTEPNLTPGLLDLLSTQFEQDVDPLAFAAYAYGVLAHPAFAVQFSAHLNAREIRVPITKDGTLFEQVRSCGAHLLWLHTYGERCVPDGELGGRVHSGAARCTEAIQDSKRSYPESFAYDRTSGSLRVGSGVIAPVPSEVWEFKVSGLAVVRSWLHYRMARGGGQKSSTLDHIRPQHWSIAFTKELLELIWVLEATVAGYADQTKLFQRVIESECFTSDELPDPPQWMRLPPASEARAKPQLSLESS